MEHFPDLDFCYTRDGTEIPTHEAIRASEDTGGDFGDFLLPDNDTDYPQNTIDIGFTLQTALSKPSRDPTNPNSRQQLSFFSCQHTFRPASTCYNKASNPSRISWHVCKVEENLATFQVIGADNKVEQTYEIEFFYGTGRPADPKYNSYQWRRNLLAVSGGRTAYDPTDGLICGVKEAGYEGTASKLVKIVVVETKDGIKWDLGGALAIPSDSDAIEIHRDPNTLSLVIPSIPTSEWKSEGYRRLKEDVRRGIFSAWKKKDSPQPTNYRHHIISGNAQEDVHQICWWYILTQSSGKRDLAALGRE